MEERILTRHPLGKKGVRIGKERYELIASEIKRALSTKDLTCTELTDVIERRLGKRFDGSIPWYTVTVKLDLEARGIVVKADRKTSKLRLKRR